MRGVLVGEAHRVVRVRRHDATQPGDPVDLCSSVELAKCTITVRWSVRGLAAMHSPMVSSTSVQRGVAIDVDVQLPTGVPILAGERPERIGLHHPLAVMAEIRAAGVVEIGLPHLHELLMIAPSANSFTCRGSSRTFPAQARATGPRRRLPPRPTSP